MIMTPEFNPDRPADMGPLYRQEAWRRLGAEQFDIVVIGGGVVGAACALALADAGLSVALVEGREPAPWQAAQPDLRVFAFAADNVQLLNRLGVRPAIAQARAWPYRRMQVWDAAGGEDLLFDADRFGRRELGYIVENGLLLEPLDISDLYAVEDRKSVV